MDLAELNKNRKIFAYEHGVSVNQVKYVFKEELVVGETYQGNCRNASEAVWNGRVRNSSLKI